MKLGRNSKILLHPHFLINFLLSASFFITKLTPFLCNHLYDTCNIDLQEYELLIFMGSFIAIRNKRQFSIPDYIAHFCMFTKLVSLVMFWKQNIVYAIIFGILWLLHACFLQRPTYSGPDKVLYLRDFTFEQDVLHGDPKINWLIAFYTVWSPSCIKLQPLFAELSQEFGSKNLKFGKLDLIRYPQYSAMYNIDTSTWSKQLPTLILFKKGQEIARRPAIIDRSKRTIQKFTFNWESIIGAFALNEQSSCQEHLSNNVSPSEQDDKKKS